MPVADGVADGVGVVDAVPVARAVCVARTLVVAVAQAGERPPAPALADAEPPVGVPVVLAPAPVVPTIAVAALLAAEAAAGEPLPVAAVPVPVTAVRAAVTPVETAAVFVLSALLVPPHAARSDTAASVHMMSMKPCPRAMYRDAIGTSLGDRKAPLPQPPYEVAEVLPASRGGW